MKLNKLLLIELIFKKINLASVKQANVLKGFIFNSRLLAIKQSVTFQVFQDGFVAHQVIPSFNPVSVLLATALVRVLFHFRCFPNFDTNVSLHATRCNQYETLN